MLKDYFVYIKEDLIQLKQNWLAIREYKQNFDTHIIYFFSLGELNRMWIFINWLDDQIKFILKAYSFNNFSEAYKLAINFEAQNKT